MTAPPAMVDLEELERVAKATYPHARLCDPGTALALVAVAREHARLVSALEFLDVHCRCDLVGQARHLPVNTQNVLALAVELGWKPEGEA